MSNPVRPCSLCRQVDDHPRCLHHIGVDLDDDRWTVSHFDCCANSGCGSCTAALQGLPVGATGEDMRAHLNLARKD